MNALNASVQLPDVAAETESVIEPKQLTLDDELIDDDLSFGEWVEALPTRLEEAA